MTLLAPIYIVIAIICFCCDDTTLPARLRSGNRTTRTSAVQEDASGQTDNCVHCEADGLAIQSEPL